MDTIVNYLDLFRANFLRLTLKPIFIRPLYRQVHWRLSMGMLLSTAFYLPMAIFKPALLLAFGPLIFGYPHLVASYRYVQKNSFLLFVFMTIIAIILHVSGVGFAHLEQLPFGIWQIVVATFTFIISRIITKHVNAFEMCASVLLCICFVRLAWLEPLLYIGGILILHNWIAFIYWIIASKERKRRLTAIVSSVIFLFIHFLVLNGNLDTWFPTQNGEIFFADGSNITGWYLASWSNDPVVWYRLLVLYAFGLSMHYFVWLRAIPESLNKFDYPNRFKWSLTQLRQDIGKNALIFSVLLGVVGCVLWLFSFPMGSALYFEIAILHGSLEIVFLISRIKRAHNGFTILD